MNKLVSLKNNLQKAAAKFKDAETRQRVWTALELAKTLVGATIMETLNKDPRRINCQVAFATLMFGTDNRVYDVQMLQRLSKDIEAVEMDHSSLLEFGAISAELKAKCFHEHRFMDVDLSYPILVDRDTGIVLDGRHRLAKSRALGQTTIMVKLMDMNKLPYAKRDIFNKITFINI